MQENRWTVMAERCCLAILLAWLVWLPLPFGSVVPGARLPLIAVPLALCAATALIRLYVTRDRAVTVQPTRAWLIFGNGALLFLAACALQLVPLPPSLLQAISDQSYAIWSGASRVAALAGVGAGTAHPLTVDPHATALELFRLTAMFAAFLTAALLIRNDARRRALAVALCTAGIFEALYGIREAALERYEIWGWPNRLVFHRVTGTFVNPNHFGHYVALLLPMALFLLAVQWRNAGPPDLPFPRRIAVLFEHRAIATGFAFAAAIVMLAGLLLSQSRGALIALAVGVLSIAALVPGRRGARVAFAAVAGLALIAGLALFLGPERTVKRFVPTEVERKALEGRRIAISAGVDLWNRFPILGSGLGTFERVVAMEQVEGLDLTYHHAHNDYVELAATAGMLGFVIGMVTLIGGYVWLARMTFGEAARELSWKRRAFQAAALASLTVAAVHALFDFNFFIPANPATLAAIAGAAVATLDHDKRTRR